MIVSVIENVKKRWLADYGYSEVLRVAFPLILSTGSWSLQQFIDRMFLTWYSSEAIAASMPAGMVSWTLASLFMGTAAYVNTFVAQYYGARRMDRIGPAVWQGIYLTIFVVLIAAVIYPFSDAFFDLMGHAKKVAELESRYFRILLFGIPFVVVSSAVSGFFSGRGNTWTVMWVNFLATGVNILLDYLWIFGKAGFPAMGIRGAAWATVCSAVLAAALFFILMIRPTFNRQYRTLSGWQFKPELFKRLIKYGLPNGLQFLLEILAFTIFIMLVGNLGVVELAASNIAFNINSLAFMPMYGLSIAVSVLVGQRLGENRPVMAEKTTWSAFHLSFGFFGVLAIAYFLIPDVFIFPFGWQADSMSFTPIRQVSIRLLRFVAFYSLFDASNMVFSAAIKGAGDTRFVAVTSVVLSWILMLFPSFLALYVLKGGIYWLWLFVTAYVVGLGIVFLWRFLRGPWRSMRVIESEEGNSGE